MSPERLLRDYFHAKDENRRALIDAVFAADARLEVRNRSDQIAFPALTVGRAAIGDVLVRRFNETYEGVRSFYLDRPPSDVRSFTCDWLVSMKERASGAVRVGCGRYDWTFGGATALCVEHLVITIEAMMVLDPDRAAPVACSLDVLSYPWTSPAAVLRVLPADLGPIHAYLHPGTGWLSSTA